jgi:hypothetical protein
VLAVTRPALRRRVAAFSAGLIGLGLLASATPAAAVTVGQLDPGDAGSVCASQVFDFVQPTVSFGNTYVVPSTGGVTNWTVSSWSTKASDDPGQKMGLKFFRKIGEPATYQAVAHQASHDLVPGLNTFATDLQVRSGDILGSHYEGSGACVFGVPDDVFFVEGADLADGASGEFESDSPYRLNATAEVTPTNVVTLGKLKAKRNGTATLLLTVPNPGDLSVGGKGVKASSAGAATAKAVNAGTVKLVIRSKGNKKRKLADTGRVTVKPMISFTPTGGTASTVARKVKLRRK